MGFSICDFLIVDWGKLGVTRKGVGSVDEVNRKSTIRKLSIPNR